MQIPDDVRRDLPPDLEPAERDALLAAAIRLQAGRPVPAPSFRGDLRRKLLGAPRGKRAGDMTRGTVRALAAAYVAAGALLMAVAAVGLAGTGPFAAG